MKKTRIMGLMIFLYLSLYVTNAIATKHYLYPTDVNDRPLKIVGIANRWKVYQPNQKISNEGLQWSYVDKPMIKPYWSVCFSKNCVLKSTFYEIPPGITVITSDIHIAFQDCTKYPGKQCNQTVSLGVYLTNSDLEQKIPKSDLHTKIPSTVKHLPKPGLDGFMGIKETFQINTSGKKFVQFQLNSEDYCGSLNNLTIFYYKCPTLSSMATFKNTIAPERYTKAKRIKGKCVKNSENLNDTKLPYFDCEWDGTGKFEGSCVCNKGYTNSSSDCKACDKTEFKLFSGNVPCNKCGNNSASDATHTSCPCSSGFFREKGKDAKSGSDCYEHPTAPKIINNTATSTGGYIEWVAQPATYFLKCLNCPIDGDISMETTSNNFTLTDLGSFAEYRFQLSFENDNTKLTGKESKTTFSLKTKRGQPGTVQNLKQTINSDSSVTLKWDAPFAKGSDHPKYVITYGSTTATTTETKYVIKSDTQTKTYTVQITVEVVVDGERLTGPPFKFDEEVKVKGGVSLNIVIGAVVGAVVFVVVVAILVFYIWRRRNPPYLQVVRMEDGTVKLPGRFLNAGKLYIDPTTYNDVDDAVQDVAFELDQKQLTIGKLLGGGEFADVYKGTLFKNGKSKEVAIKTLKPGAAKRDRDDFLSEAAIIGQFTDANVISLEGVILKERPNVIVLEFMANGSLDKYLQVNDMQFTNLQLLGMARGVASGMKYLSELGFIHRDLAARNVLVDEHRTCKVSDFGMSREIKVDETYDTQGGKIPVRWTAPEAIQFKKFTPASDVWSYGILLWEIMSYGERPYWDWGNYEVLERLNQGYRLPPPMNCPKVVHDLMLVCWNKDRSKRPKMNALRDQLERWIRNPTLLESTASVIVKTDENLDYTVLQTISKWLDAIGMGRYTEQFIDQGFATPRQVLQLNLEDLEGLGIGPIGHRKKIYKAIQNTKAQVEQRHNTVSPRKKTLSVSGRKNNPTA